MREMMRTIFSSITVAFSAFEKGAKTVENYASWAEQESAAFEAEAQVERQARLAALKVKLTVAA